MDSILDLKGRTALVTGAGQGVGRATALLLAAHNAGCVVVNDFHLDRAESVAGEIRARGGNALALQADVTDYASVQAMLQRVGPVAILVNNAGNAGPEPVAASLPEFWETDPAEWGRWTRTNLEGVMHCCHAALPGMIEAGYGRIVTVVSDAGRVGEPQYVVYSGAKAGAAGFMRALAKAAGRHGVTANCVSLSAIMTPGLAARLEDPERKRKVLQRYVVKRLGEPEDAANAILFLTSDAASWVTGQSWAVNGGYAITP